MFVILWRFTSEQLDRRWRTLNGEPMYRSDAVEALRLLRSDHTDAVEFQMAQIVDEA